MGMHRGFTLVEILIVLAIVSIALSIGAIGLAQVRLSQESRAGVGSVRQIILAGATAAASRGIALELVRSGNRLNLRNPADNSLLREVDIPAGIAGQLPSGTWLSYTPTGMVLLPTGFTNPFTLTDRGKTYTLQISLIGEVRLGGL